MNKPLLISIILLFVCSTTVFADPYAIIHGAKAQAMGGAFDAVADDPASIYYNPAGLISLNKTNELITDFELGNGVTFNLQEGQCAGNYAGRTPCSKNYFKADDIQYFLSASYLWDKYALSIAFYNLYNIIYPVTLSLQKQSLSTGAISNASSTSYIGQNVNILQSGFAMKPANFLSIGVTGAGVFSTFEAMSDGYIVNEFTIGVFGSVGALAQVINNDQIKVNIGSSYRSPSAFNFPIKAVFMGASTATSYFSPQSTSINDRFIWNIPGEFSLGTAIILTPADFTITLAGDYRYTDYNKTYLDINRPNTFNIKPVQTYSLGTEVGIFNLALRGGFFSSQDSIKLFDTDGFTAGLGYKFGDQHIEISYKHTNYYTNTSGLSLSSQSSNTYAASIYWVL
ncbi:MAG: hypothetical protein HQK91_01820 [Nitrospirae bacterium]|nr:hypothetical protein [Nitrospirota bacterium]